MTDTLVSQIEPSMERRRSSEATAIMLESGIDEKKDVIDPAHDDNAVLHATTIAAKKRALYTTDGDLNVGYAVMEQREIIPATGRRRPTTKWEYWTFCIFYFSVNAAPINGSGGALRQALLSQQFPDGQVQWGGEKLPLNSYLLDLTGIQFGAQLFCLLLLGPYADYGNWRPWIMIVTEVLLYIAQYAMVGISKPSQWQAANAIYIIGVLLQNVCNAFYQATFPSLVRDLPNMIESERQVLNGEKAPEEHAELDSYERSRLYNLCNIIGSSLVVGLFAVAVGISAGVGYSTPHQLITSYRVLMAYFATVCVICTMPYFLLQKFRPGQQLPQNTNFLTAGPKQVWSALKGARKLKQCILYLIAWFLLQEMSGTAGSIQGILQNEVIHYDPLILNAMNLCSDLAGGSGTVFQYFIQKRYRFSVKQGVAYGAIMAMFPSFWGAIGYFTNKIGFHHVWEFWLFAFWNFQTASWGAYAVTQISEVVPAPKMFMFFALFNCVGKTSGFIGPFITSAIIKRAGGNSNAGYWFLFPMGLLGNLVLFFVNNTKAKIDNARFLEQEAAEMYSEEQRNQRYDDETDPGSTA